MAILLDVDEEALKALVRAISNNCIAQGTKGKNDIKNAVEQFKPKYRSLSVDLLRGAIIMADGGAAGRGRAEDGRPLLDPDEEALRAVVHAVSHNCVVRGTSAEDAVNQYQPRYPSLTQDLLRGAIFVAGGVTSRQQPSYGGAYCSKVEDADDSSIPSGGKRQAATRGPGRPPKSAKRLCDIEGCTSRAVKGGLCWTHGGKAPHSLCSVEGCNRHSQRAGLCLAHGAPLPRCKVDGCTHIAKIRGMCRKHSGGAPRFFCMVEGCGNVAVRGGVRGGALCGKHCGLNEKKKNNKRICFMEGCHRGALKGGLCARHSERCGLNGCDNAAYGEEGLCRKHAAEGVGESVVGKDGGKEAKATGMKTKDIGETAEVIGEEQDEEAGEVGGHHGEDQNEEGELDHKVESGDMDAVEEGAFNLQEEWPSVESA